MFYSSWKKTILTKPHPSICSTCVLHMDGCGLCLYAYISFSGQPSPTLFPLFCVWSAWLSALTQSWSAGIQQPTTTAAGYRRGYSVTHQIFPSILDPQGPLTGSDVCLYWLLGCVSDLIGKWPTNLCCFISFISTSVWMFHFFNT